MKSYQIGEYYLKYSESHNRYEIVNNIYHYPLGYIQLDEGNYVFISRPSMKYECAEIDVIKQFMEVLINEN